MFRPRALVLLALAFILAAPAKAQDSIRILDPQSLSGVGSGWSVNPATGQLGMVFPFAAVPGDIPIALPFQMKASHMIETRPVFDPIAGRSFPMDMDRPMQGGMHFGYISPSATYDGYTEAATYVLEDGSQFRDRDFTAYNPSGVTLDAPGEFHLAAKTWSQVRTHVSTRLITYDAVAADLGTLAVNAAALAPQGFTASTGYKVIMDKDRARIYVYLPELNAWVPILWLDRFGHSVGFQWKKGAYTGFSVYSVVALNQQTNLGVQVQWAVPLDTTTEVNQVLLRADYIGFQAPSIQVTGYSGVAQVRPTAMAGLAVTIISPAQAGPVLRPTQINSGDPHSATLPLPAWSSGGLPIPSNSGSDPWGDALQWTFTYEPTTLAELTDFTDPLGDATHFTYETDTLYNGAGIHNQIRSVKGANSVDTATAVQLTRAWTRVLPVPFSSTTWKTTLTQSFSSGDTTEIPTQEWTFAGPDQNAVFYGNGALLSTRLYTPIKTYSTQTFVPSIYGIDGSLSVSGGPSVAMDGRPTQVVTSTQDPLSGVANIETLKVGGTTFQTVAYTYEVKLGLLDPGRLTSVDTSRLVNGQPVAAPTHTIDYDPITGLPAHDYMESGILKRGKAFSYDIEGHLKQVDSYPAGTPSVSTVYTPGPTGPTDATTTFSSPNGGITSFKQYWTYSPAGRVTSATDGRGVTTSTSYDARGRLRSVTTDGSPSTTISYPSEFERDWSISVGAAGSETTDAFGRLVSRTRPDGIVETPTYDVLGRTTVLSQVSGGSARSSSATYDPLGRTKTASSYASPLSQNLAYTSDGTNTTVTTTLSNNVVSSVSKDPLGQTVGTTDPWSTVTSQYNVLGLPTHLVQTADGLTQHRDFDYDPLGSLKTRTEPETGTTTFSGFDALGNPTSISDAVRTRTLAFDGLGRLRSVSGGTESLSWVFNGLQVLNASTVSNGQTVSQDYAFGPASSGARLASETLNFAGVAQTTGYTYDATGRLDTLTYPSGRKAKYGGYDSLGRVGSITQNSNPLATVHYDPIWGSRSDITFASGAKSSWVAAPPTGVNLQSWTIAPAAPAPAETYAYGVDGNGNLNKGAGWDPLSHDTAGRLTNASGFGETVALSHDGFGNNTSSTTAPLPAGSNNFGFTTMPDNKVPTQTSTPTVTNTGWHYQVNGEADQIGSATGLTPPVIGLTWDGLGRLSSAMMNGTAWINTYAPSGMRVQLIDSINAANNRRYAYTSGGLLLGEYVQGGAAGHASAKAAKVYHRASGGDISRGLGAFSAGETVTVTVWFKAPVGRTASAYLTDNAAYSPTDAKKFASMPGNGDWQQLTFSETLSASAANLGLHLYGDMYTTTSSSATDSTFVTYDDVLVSSSTRGTVMTEDFESGISAWGSCSGNLALAQPGTVPDQWKRDVIYLGGEAIAEVDAASVHELHNDHLGSPRVITNAATGAVEGRQVFGPYGEKLPSYTSGYAPLTGYTGHLAQDPSGLTYMRGRFYSPAWHRFLNSDQGVDPSTWNQMAYVGGSPMMAIDPSGLIKLICKGGVLWMHTDGGDGTSVDVLYYENGSLVPCGGGSGGGPTGGGNPGGGPSGNSGGWQGGLPGMPGSPAEPPKPPDCASALGFTGLGASIAEHNIASGVSISTSGKMYSNFYGNQYTKVLGVSEAAKGLGGAVAAVGVLYGGYQYSQDQISGLRYFTDTAAAGFAVFGGPPGAAGAGIYFVGMYAVDQMPAEPYVDRSKDPQYTTVNGKKSPRCY